MSSLQRQQEALFKMKVNSGQKEKLKIILDSNAFFLPIQFKVDIFAELEKLLNRSFEPVILSPVKSELEALTRKELGNNAKNARFALELTEKCSYYEENEPQDTSVDDVIVTVARKWCSPVFTNDKQLKKRLRDISVPVIYLRQKSHLEIDGMI